MTHAQLVWAALIAANLLVNLPFAYHHLTKGKTTMILAQFQPVIDQLNASAAAITAATEAQAGSVPAQDVADTLTAVQAGADAVKAAIPAAS